MAAENPISPQALPSSVAGFTPIPVLYSSTSTHILYARAHLGSKKTKAKDVKGKAADLPEGRTLFLVNIPPDATEREMTLFFKGCGTVERVVFTGDAEGPEEDMADEADSDEEMEDVEKKDASEDENGERPRKKRKVHPAPQVVPLPAVLLRTLRRTGRSAHVVFLDDSSLSRALALSSKPRPWPTDASAPLGLSHYTTLYASLRPPLDVVKAHADSWMKAFEYEEAKKKQQSKYKKGEAIVDEDGFTLVTRGGAYGKTLGGDVGVASIKFQKDQSASGGKGKRARKHKKEKMEKGSFYAFQIHEKKRNELIELKKNWEADKEKVEKMKSSRKFKPY